MPNPITTHAITTINTDPPIHLARFSDTTTGDPYDVVTMTMENRTLDIPLGEAMRFGEALQKAATIPPPNTPTSNNG